MKATAVIERFLVGKGWEVALRWSVALLVLAAAFSAAPVIASERNGTSSQAAAQEQVYGSQLMTPQERSEHRAKMRAAKTLEEREQIRREHHERMKERARERGMTLPDAPPVRGGGRNR